MSTVIESPRHETAARAEQVRIRDQINQWREARATKQQALVTAQQRTVDQMLSGVSPSKATQHETQIRAEIEAIDRVLTALDEQYSAAVRAVKDGKLADLKVLLEQARAASAEHDKETHRLMELVRKHEGPNARLTGETQGVYLVQRIINLEHAVTNLEVDLGVYR